MTAMTEDDTLHLTDAPPIDGLRFRRPRGDDADYEAIAEVIAAANFHDGIRWLPTARNLREGIESSDGVDPATDMVITEIDSRSATDRGSPMDGPWHHLSGRRWRIRSCVPT